ncbi:hypothetical protein HK103_005098 [Boothiomyces macroporosus]|uniref:Ankyrin repeat protein n=1 Tax=Boothiomyces macroporosus TaxID=261099 RepID=A0AAD5UJX8_9FUNG|nr:hypothetical protein HK103_005098 [Boothiomyces macroporosus]
MFSLISNEIQEISKHLNCKEYQTLKFAIKLNFKPHVCTLQSLKESLELTEGSKERLMLDYKYFNDESFEFVCKAELLALLGKFVSRNISVSSKLKYQAFQDWVDAAVKYNQDIVYFLFMGAIEYSQKSNLELNISDIRERSVFLGYTRIYEYLLRNMEINPANSDNYDFRIACHKGYTDLVELLLADSRTDPSADSNYAIRFSSLHGHVKVVELLLNDSRVDPSDSNNQAICMAAEFGRHKVVELLLRHPKVDPTVDFNYALRRACFFGLYDTVKVLLKNERVDPTSMGNYALLWASRNCFYDVVDLLLADKRVDKSVLKKRLE